MTDKIREAFNQWLSTADDADFVTLEAAWTSGYQACASELRAELEAAKKDAERLDYVLRKQLIVVQDCDDEYFTYNSSSGRRGPLAENERAAVDAAMSEVK